MQQPLGEQGPRGCRQLVPTSRLAVAGPTQGTQGLLGLGLQGLGMWRRSSAAGSWWDSLLRGRGWSRACSPPPPGCKQLPASCPSSLWLQVSRLDRVKMSARRESAGQGRHPESTPTPGSFTLLQHPQLWGLVSGTDRALPSAPTLRYWPRGGRSGWKREVTRPDLPLVWELALTYRWSGRRQGWGQPGGSEPFPGPRKKGLCGAPAPSPRRGHIPGQRPGLLAPAGPRG